jgi:hypothetical protein
MAHNSHAMHLQCPGRVDLYLAIDDSITGSIKGHHMAENPYQIWVPPNFAKDPHFFEAKR